MVVKFGDADFDTTVTVYAREQDAVQKLLHPKAREVLKRALWERDIAPTFLLGEKVLLFSHTALAEKATKLESLERLAADLLSLYAVLVRDKR
jgi:hypothetical protein